MAKTQTSSRPIAVLALLLAWLVPGAGHAYIGRLGRGIVIFVTVSATFWAGIAVGGVMTVDQKYEKWWFVAQVCAGVHGLVGWYRQHRVYEELAETVEVPIRGGSSTQQISPERVGVDDLLTRKGLVLVAPQASVARTYTGIAGLMNLMCVFDAFILSLMGLTGEPTEPKEGEPEHPRRRKDDRR